MFKLATEEEIGKLAEGRGEGHRADGQQQQEQDNDMPRVPSSRCCNSQGACASLSPAFTQTDEHYRRLQGVLLLQPMKRFSD
jgi:hypothetical protein